MPESAPETPNANTARRHWIQAYIAGYVVLIVGYIAYLATGSETVKTSEWIEKAFPGHTGVTAKDLQAVANQKEAEIRVWAPLSFEGKDGLRRNYKPGERLILAEAIAYAESFLATKADPNAPPATLKLYREGFLTERDWPYVLTFYNLIGFYMLLRLFAWGPLSGFLEDTGKKTTEALQAARDARAEAEALKKRHEEILAEVEKRKREIAGSAESELAEEKKRIVEMARREAEGMLVNVKSSLDAEVRAAGERLRKEIARELQSTAQEILEKEAAPADHARALDEFTAELEKAKLA